MTWLVSGVRTPFSRVDGPFRRLDAVALSVPVAKAMAAQLAKGDRSDLLVWGTVVPGLGWSNIAREVQLQAGIDPSTPAFSTVLACSTPWPRSSKRRGYWARTSMWRCAAASRA
jgi:acetyl-CoA C-acetyltransferase